MDYLTPYQCLALKETQDHPRPPTYDALMKAIQRDKLQAIRPARDYLIDLFEDEEFYKNNISKREAEDIRVAIIKALSRIGDRESVEKLEEYSKKKFAKTLFRKDTLSNTAKIVLGHKSK